MIKFFGKNNDLRTEEGKITKLGYAVMMLSTVFGLCVFGPEETCSGRADAGSEHRLCFAGAPAPCGSAPARRNNDPAGKCVPVL